MMSIRTRAVTTKMMMMTTNTHKAVDLYCILCLFACFLLLDRMVDLIIGIHLKSAAHRQVNGPYYLFHCVK